MTPEVLLMTSLGLSLISLVLALFAVHVVNLNPPVVEEPTPIQEPVKDLEKVERIKVIETEHRHLCSEIEGAKEELQNKLLRASDEEKPALIERIATLQKIIDESENLLKTIKGDE